VSEGEKSESYNTPRKKEKERFDESLRSSEREKRKNRPPGKERITPPARKGKARARKSMGGRTTRLKGKPDPQRLLPTALTREEKGGAGARSFQEELPSTKTPRKLHTENSTIEQDKGSHSKKNERRVATEGNL